METCRGLVTEEDARGRMEADVPVPNERRRCLLPLDIFYLDLTVFSSDSTRVITISELCLHGA